VSDPTDPGHAPGEACPTCGFAVPSGARFCPNCGTPRDERDAPPADSDATGVMAPVGAPIPVREEVRQAPGQLRDRPWPWGLIIGVPVVLIALLIIILALQGGGDKGGGDTTTTTSPPTTAVSTTITRRTETTRPSVTTRPVATTAPATTEPPTTQPPTTQPPVTASVP
jgi:hypothetical protein